MSHTPTTAELRARYLEAIAGRHDAPVPELALTAVGRTYRLLLEDALANPVRAAVLRRVAHYELSSGTAAGRPGTHLINALIAGHDPLWDAHQVGTFLTSPWATQFGIWHRIGDKYESAILTALPWPAVVEMLELLTPAGAYTLDELEADGTDYGAIDWWTQPSLRFARTLATLDWAAADERPGLADKLLDSVRTGPLLAWTVQARLFEDGYPMVGGELLINKVHLRARDVRAA